jgi:hypothetical protein
MKLLRHKFKNDVEKHPISFKLRVYLSMKVKVIGI